MGGTVAPASPSGLGPAMRLAGWLSVLGMAMVIVEMATTLPYMPESWWLPPEGVPLPPGAFDLRLMEIHPGLLGWLGAWGYLASWVWLPVAVWRLSHSERFTSPQDRALLILVPLLVLAIQGLLRLTPLKYGYPLA